MGHPVVLPLDHGMELGSLSTSYDSEAVMSISPNPVTSRLCLHRPIILPLCSASTWWLMEMRIWLWVLIWATHYVLSISHLCSITAGRTPNVMTVCLTGETCMSKDIMSLSPQYHGCTHTSPKGLQATLGQDSLGKLVATRPST